MSQAVTLKEEFLTFLSANNISQSKVAQDIAKSTSYISQWINGKFPGNIVEFEAAIQSWLEMQKEKANLKSVETPFVPIANARTVFGILNRARIDHKIILVTSESGYGKTESLKEFSRRNAGTILIETDSTFSSKILIGYLHKNLGYSGRGTTHSMMEEIITSLTGSSRLIIIDEADRLSYHSLELLRRLHDKSKIGIALVGAPVLVENIRGSKGEFAQLYTRIGGHAQLKPLSLADAESITKSYLPQINGQAKTFYQFCQKNGRTLYMLIYNTIRVAQENNCDITDDLIEKCAGMLAI